MSKDSNTMNAEASTSRINFKQVARQITVLNRKEKEMIYDEVDLFLCKRLSECWHIVSGSELSIKKQKSGGVWFRLRYGNQTCIFGELHGIYSSHEGTIIMDWDHIDVSPSAISGCHCYFNEDLYNLVDWALEQFAQREGLRFVRKLFTNKLIIFFNLDKFDVEVEENPPFKPTESTES